MSEEPPVWDQLGDLLQAGWAVVRANDTFKTATLGAAEALEKHAEKHESLAKHLAEGNVRNIVGRGSEDLAQQLNDEAAAQKQLAKKLPQLGGPPRKKPSDA